MVCRIQQMIFAIHALVIAAADRKLGLKFGQRTESVSCFSLRFARENSQPDAFEARGRAGKIRVDQFFVQPDGFEHLAP